MIPYPIELPKRSISLISQKIRFNQLRFEKSVVVRID